jgi:uncharacterized protein YecE (DUF72 family)
VRGEATKKKTEELEVVKAEKKEEAKIRVGTSAFTADGWEGSFYPKGLPPRVRLSYYATQFDTVELDNRFYRTPALSTVRGWYAKTPPGFVFAAKVPQVITHEKVLVGCDEDLKHFLDHGRAEREAWAAAVSVRVLQQFQVQEWG